MAHKGYATNESIYIICNAAGMAQIHQSCIIHRKLAQSHALLDENWYPTICDLDISVPTNGDNKEYVWVSLYIALEMIDNKTQCFTKMDNFKKALLWI